MEMLPEFGDNHNVEVVSTILRRCLQGGSLNWKTISSGVLTSSHQELCLMTEKLLEIIGIECASTTQYLINWRESHINIYIAGIVNLIEKLGDRGAGAIFEVETLTEAAVAANTQETSWVVEDMWVKPVDSIGPELSLQQNSLLGVGGEMTHIETKHSDIASSFRFYLWWGQEKTARADNDLCVSKQSGRRARGSRSEAGRRICEVIGFRNHNVRWIILEIGYFQRNRVQSKESIKTSRTEGSRSGLRPTQEEKRTASSPIRLSIHEGSSSVARAGAPAACLQTECCNFFTIQLVSRNLSPCARHGGRVVLISEPVSHEIPASPLHCGQGSRHGAMFEAWSGRTASVGVESTIQFVMSEITTLTTTRSSTEDGNVVIEQNPEME